MIDTQADERVELQDTPLVGVFPDFGTLGPGAIVKRAALAKMLRCSDKTVGRMIERGELPRPFRFMGGDAWTCGAIVEHWERQQGEAQQEAERDAQRLSKIAP